MAQKQYKSSLSNLENKIGDKNVSLSRQILSSELITDLVSSSWTNALYKIQNIPK